MFKKFLFWAEASGENKLLLQERQWCIHNAIQTHNCGDTEWWNKTVHALPRGQMLLSSGNWHHMLPEFA